MKTLKYLDEISLALTHMERAAKAMRDLQKQANENQDYAKASWFAHNAKLIEEVIQSEDEEATGFRSFVTQEHEED